MIVPVLGENISRALRLLDKKMLSEAKRLKIRGFAKKSERVRFKAFLAERFRLKTEKRRIDRLARFGGRGRGVPVPVRK